MEIGKLIKQPQGYKTFIPNKFPPKEKFNISDETQRLHAKAAHNLGKLDGITQLLPDLKFFIFMYIKKEATLSSEIEGTRATMVDVIKTESKLEKNRPDDVDRILHYIKAMEYGLARLKTFPLSLRFIKEIHYQILNNTKDAPGKTPGEFRNSQNWISGTKPENADFVPPPVPKMKEALYDLEKFLYDKNSYSPLLKAALVHAQFETIHPFLDGNGRTGRLLTTFYLCKLKLLGKPVLYLSAYFLENKKMYYNALHKYHSENSDINMFLQFFLQGIIEIADDAIMVSKKINILRKNDLNAINEKLDIRNSKNAIIVLDNLYRLPIISVKQVEKWTKLSRPAANELVKKLVNINILIQSNKKISYAREFTYKKYLDLFN